MNCTNCNHPMGAEDRFCFHCGAERNMGRVNLGPNQKPWVKADKDHPMTHCDRCDRQVPLVEEIQTYCPDCGAEIHEPTGMYCPECGTRMQETRSQCPVCGAEIDEYGGRPLAGLRPWLYTISGSQKVYFTYFAKVLAAILFAIGAGIYLLVRNLLGQ